MIRIGYTVYIYTSYNTRYWLGCYKTRLEAWVKARIARSQDRTAVHHETVRNR